VLIPIAPRLASPPTACRLVSPLPIRDLHSIYFWPMSPLHCRPNQLRGHLDATALPSRDLQAAIRVYSAMRAYVEVHLTLTTLPHPKLCIHSFHPSRNTLLPSPNHPRPPSSAPQNPTAPFPNPPSTLLYVSPHAPPKTREQAPYGVTWIVLLQATESKRQYADISQTRLRRKAWRPRNIARLSL